ncbi:hypothetical protein [Arthrobacter sp. NEB 688]|uniref:hypothetical protein n=1 Tax=Arthrobacter sp. NEB 688 TaxID=904039 RepID=UPI0015648CAE|nr:hypothetical protein [Arthrobacter sp. NEB 688]QKE82950.1 hypothetical protein HL663_02610 [Arthrobacter sp. NEB 688]
MISPEPRTAMSNDDSTLTSSIDEPDPLEDSFIVLPNEHLVTFFFKMPTPLGWPTNKPIRLTELVSWQFRDFAKAALESDVEYPTPHLFSSSLLFHEVEEDVVESSSLASILRAVDIGFPVKKEELSEVADSALGGGDDDKLGKASIVEVIVPLGATFLLRHFNAGTAPPSMPDLADPPQELISDAMDAAIDAVRTLQSAHVAALRQPVKMLSRAQLPLLIPYGLRSATQSPPEGGKLEFMLANGRVDQLGVTATLTESQQLAIMQTRDHPARVRAYTDLYNQASVALHVEGNTRECVIMIGAASEVFLNILMLLLRWEEGQTPEQCVASWNDSFAVRLRTELPPKLGGNWSNSGEAAFARWHKSTYGVRNRVAHAGHEPTFEECIEAIAALDNLISDIGARLTSGQRLRKYPRVSTMLFGSRLAPRLVKLPWLVALQGDPTEVPWMITSGRWLDTHYRLMHDATDKRTPDPAAAELFSTWNTPSSGPQSWFLVDRASALAAEVEVDATRVPTSDSLLAAEDLGPDTPLEPPAIVGHDRTDGDVLHVGPWVEAYHLNHLLGVMVDGTDAEQPWPLMPRTAPAPTRRRSSRRGS